jgi:diguanylate cyclase (GGDEF)-like protein
MSVVAIIAIGLLGQKVPLIRYLDEQLISYRFSGAPRSASGSIVFLAIDKKTLDSVGTWPWPRSLYAAALKKLTQANVDDIFIDIDFSTPSTPKEDDRLATALHDAGGGVILPIFKQHASVSGSGIESTKPIPSLAQNAWLASSNMFPDDDGLLRRFTLGDVYDDELVQTVPALLSKSSLTSGAPRIDLSILPASIPTISFGDLLDPAFDLNRLTGRSVVIGSYATELKDIFTVPVYGQLSGPMIHILASETLLQGRVLAEFDQKSWWLAYAVLVSLTVFAMKQRRTLIAVLLLVAPLLAGEAVAFFLQEQAGVVLYTSSGWMMTLVGLALLMIEKLDLSRLIAEIASAEKRNMRRLLGKIIVDSSDGILAFDHRLKVFEESRSVRAMLSIGDDIEGKPLHDILPADISNLLDNLVAVHRSDRKLVQSSSARFSFCVSGRTKHLEVVATISPTTWTSEAGTEAPDTFIGSLVIRDVTARQTYEDRLHYLSKHDDLTGVLNRRAFSDQIDREENCPLVFAVGLCRLSVVNTTMGRDFGDELLRGVSARLLMHDDFLSVGRLGGDVFAVTVAATPTVEIERCARTILEIFDSPLEIAGTLINVSVRVGASWTDAATDDHRGAIEKAEQALEEAQTVAGSGWRAYDPASALRQFQTRKLEHAMRESLEKGDFFLQYQPQIDFASGAVVGAEALLRWSHPDLGLISPATFIPIAETNGFICELGNWALLEACRDAAAWPDQLSVAVNVAAIQLLRDNFVAEVKEALGVSDLPASRLHLEITESALVEHSAPIIEMIEELRDMGITIALDDFGTGYSSLSYLAGFPLDKLKIDQSFVRKMSHDPQSLAIIQAVKALASGLGLAVVAEGVETQCEADLLKAMGCEVAQGYLYGRPQSSSELLSLLAKSPLMTAA